jgi:hypothetical protein
MKSQFFLTMILFPCLWLGVSAKTQASNMINSLRQSENLPSPNFSVRQNISSIGSWNLGTSPPWEIAARGEVTEDCLLYGICSDDDDDDDKGEDDNS